MTLSPVNLIESICYTPQYHDISQSDRFIFVLLAFELAQLLFQVKAFKSESVLSLNKQLNEITRFTVSSMGIPAM